MEERRNNIEIMKDVLSVCLNGSIKTQIVYKANSNFVHVKPFIEKALSKGLLEEREGRFYTTDKGKEFILRVLDILAMLGGE